MGLFSKKKQTTLYQKPLMYVNDKENTVVIHLSESAIRKILQAKKVDYSFTFTVSN